MKRTLTMSFIITLVILGCAFVRSPAGTGSEPVKTPSPQLSAPPLDADEDRHISLLYGEEMLDIAVSDYLVGVLAAEMPVSFEPEALKAQAVAARSYLERNIAEHKHDKADICSSPDCCQAYISESELKDSWGKNYDAYISKLQAAVEDTDSEYLSYGGEAALCAFHASSSGLTEDSGELWGDLPYLVSVDSPETKEDVPNYISKKKLSDLDFRDTILFAHPEADMTGDADTWIGKVTRNDSGRVTEAVIGGVKFSGAQLRALFSLRSAAFTISHKDGYFTFKVTGSGHGVGMSQYGANVMAKKGSDYKQILSHYYPGTVLTQGKK